jgi:Fe2+ or Zn2+ uptake regulation protein/O6-methylguanine-DNA--protein-cysteine methyltransferase
MSADDSGALLRRHRLRVTPQRRAILQAFRGTQDEHLSAEEVMSRASVAVPEIGRGTVYATLAELTEIGLLSSVGNPEPVRYETNVEPHDHFRCRLCLRLFDVELGGREVSGRGLDGYVIESVWVHAEGICADCQSYERGMMDGAEGIMRSPTLSEQTIADLSCLRVDSPLGALALVASADGIVRVAFSDHADYDTLMKRATSRRGPGAGRGRLKDLGVTFGNYFTGDRQPAANLVDWRLMSELGAEALRVVQRIPYATSCSYNLLSSALGAYECGYVIGTNPVPLLIPCHRVSRGSERLEAYVGGVDRLHVLQTLEG